MSGGGCVVSSGLTAGEILLLATSSSPGTAYRVGYLSFLFETVRLKVRKIPFSLFPQRQTKRGVEDAMFLA